MASSRRTTKTRSSSRRRRRRNQISNKKQSPKQNKKQKEVISTDTDITVCSTPKGQKFMIPQISTCPPPPKKKRVLTNCSFRKSLSFFVPPDLDVFFRLALQDVSVPLVC